MAITNSKIEGRITVPDGGWAVSVTEIGGGGTQTVTVPAGDYYHSSGDTIADDLEKEFDDQLDASPLTGNYTVSIANSESGTGKVTISATGITSFTLTWTAPDLRDVLGFTTNLTPTGLTFTGANQARSLWLPDSPYQSINGDKGGFIETDFRAMETMSGNAFLFTGERRRINQLSWPAISRAKTWQDSETTVNASIEQFFIDVQLKEVKWSKTAGGPIRWYPDAAVDGTFFTYHATTWSEFRPEFVREQWTGLWRVSIPRLVVKP